jgi:hypothetical protein
MTRPLVIAAGLTSLGFLLGLGWAAAQPAAESLDRRHAELHTRCTEARLRAEIWEDPAFLAEPIDVLQMQIDQLGDQMQDMLDAIDNAPALDRR